MSDNKGERSVGLRQTGRFDIKDLIYNGNKESQSWCRCEVSGRVSRQETQLWVSCTQRTACFTGERYPEVHLSEKTTFASCSRLPRRLFSTCRCRARYRCRRLRHRCPSNWPNWRSLILQHFARSSALFVRINNPYQYP